MAKEAQQRPCQSAMAAAFLATETGLPIFAELSRSTVKHTVKHTQQQTSEDREPELLEGLPLWILENQQHRVCKKKLP